MMASGRMFMFYGWGNGSKCPANAALGIHDTDGLTYAEAELIADYDSLCATFTTFKSGRIDMVPERVAKRCWYQAMQRNLGAKEFGTDVADELGWDLPEL